MFLLFFCFLQGGAGLSWRDGKIACIEKKQKMFRKIPFQTVKKPMYVLFSLCKAGYQNFQDHTDYAVTGLVK